MSDQRATRNSAEKVLMVSPVDFTPAKAREWIERLGLPESTAVWVDPCIGAGSVYAMTILDMLRNRWQDFTLGVGGPEAATAYFDPRMT